jgi:hypothetical protein
MAAAWIEQVAVLTASHHRRHLLALTEVRGTRNRRECDPGGEGCRRGESESVYAQSRCVDSACARWLLDLGMLATGLGHPMTEGFIPISMMVTGAAPELFTPKIQVDAVVDARLRRQLRPYAGA